MSTMCFRTPEMVEKMMREMLLLRAKGLTWAKVATRLNRTSIPGPRWEKWTGDRAMKTFFIYKKTVDLDSLSQPLECLPPKSRCRSAAAKRSWKTRRANGKIALHAPPFVDDFETEDPPRRPRGRPPGSKTTMVKPTLQISYSEAAGRVQISLAYDGPHRAGLAEAFATRARALLG